MVGREIKYNPPPLPEDIAVLYLLANHFEIVANISKKSLAEF
ncbi:MAG: hypothetical protein RR140_02480 [Clostridia bacterium]